MEKLKIVAQFDIPYIRYLDQTGEPVQGLPAFAHSKETLVAMYRMMVLTRQFDRRAINLQRTGKLGTYPATLGQEAIGVGIGAAMAPTDVLLPYYREYAAQFWRGVKMEEILLYWGGSELGCRYQDANVKADFPIAVPIASQTLHAVGVAAALKLQNKTAAALTVIGDGGTSRGDFYEAINVAGAWALPVVFVINNNQWAISVSREQQSKAKTLAQKAFAGGLQGYQVDGNDAVAVRQVVTEALARARTHHEACVIEAITYRMCDHTTADDASRYRDPEQLAAHQATDPVQRLRDHLVQYHGWDKAQEKALSEEAAAQVNEAVARYLNTPVQPKTALFDYLYETLPTAYESQYEALMTSAEGE